MNLWLFTEVLLIESYNREAFMQECNARLDVGVEIRLWMMRLMFVKFDKRARLLVAEFQKLSCCLSVTFLSPF